MKRFIFFVVLPVIGITWYIQQETDCIESDKIPLAISSKFMKVEAPYLLKRAIGKEGRGKLCEGNVYQLKDDETIEIYRVTSNPTPYGRWWTLENPSGTSKSKYRADYGICPEFSNLENVFVCTLKEGSNIVIGSGQSIDCKNESYKQSSKLQIYLEKSKENTFACQ